MRRLSIVLTIVNSTNQYDQDRQKVVASGQFGAKVTKYYRNPALNYRRFIPAEEDAKHVEAYSIVYSCVRICRRRGFYSAPGCQHCEVVVGLRDG